MTNSTVEMQDLLKRMETTLNKANYVQESINNSFFERWSPMQNEEDRLGASYDFDRYAIFSLILNDNLEQLTKEFSELQKAIVEQQK